MTLNFKLRPYQEKIISELRQSFLSNYSAPLVVSPTGSGKTIIFTYIATHAASKGYRTLIVVHRSYLWQQVSDQLKSLGVPHGIIAPGHTQTNDLIQVASVDTLIRRLHKISRPNCIIYDEAHHVVRNNKWGKVANYFDTKIIGVTATPCRTNGSGLGINCGGFFDTLIYGPQISDLQPEYLSPFKLFAPDIGVNLTGVKRIAGDYDKKQLLERVDNKKIYGDVPKHYKKICNGIPAIAFCVSVKHTEHVAEEFNSHGIPSAPVSGKTQDNKRRELFNGLANGKYKVLCSCDLVSEGFDVPVCGAAICLRPTQSTGLCMQQWGRTTRIAPGKKYAYIIDHVGNYLRHGFPDDDREWSLEGQKRKNKKTEETKVLTKVCPECFGVHRPQLTCPYCGHIYQSKDKQPTNDKDVELQEIDKKKFKIQKQIMVSQAKTLDELYSVADKLGYKKGWAYYVYKSRQKKKVQHDNRTHQLTQ